MGLGPVNEILMSNKPSLTESYVHGRKNSKCLTPQFLPLWIHPRVVFECLVVVVLLVYTALQIAP